MPWYRTARGRVSNAGDIPRYIGLLPCPKAEGGVLVYRSLSELSVAQFLTWSPRVRKILYEARVIEFPASGDLPAMKCWPDFEIVLDTGEVEWIEAKHSPDSLSERKRTELELIAAHFAREHRRYRVIFYTDLARDGFIDTISLLRPYAELQCDTRVLERAERRLRTYGETHLDGWLVHARAEGVRVDVLYHLLYHQRLRLLYRAVVHTELRPWRD